MGGPERPPEGGIDTRVLIILHRINYNGKFSIHYNNVYWLRESKAQKTQQFPKSGGNTGMKIHHNAA